MSSAGALDDGGTPLDCLSIRSQGRRRAFHITYPSPLTVNHEFMMTTQLRGER